MVILHSDASLCQITPSHQHLQICFCIHTCECTFVRCWVIYVKYFCSVPHKQYYFLFNFSFWFSFYSTQGHDESLATHTPCTLRRMSRLQVAGVRDRGGGGLGLPGKPWQCLDPHLPRRSSPSRTQDHRTGENFLAFFWRFLDFFFCSKVPKWNFLGRLGAFVSPTHLPVQNTFASPGVV